MSFFISLFSFFNLLQYQIIWKDTVVEIPLHEDVYNYVDQPYAELYLNEIKLFDPDMYYQIDGVERTFLKTVNTKYVNTYHVYFKVYFPSYGKTGIQSITFQVVDHIPPEIIYVPSFKIPIGSSMPKVLDGLVYKDNYDAIESLTLTADTSQVILNKIGLYTFSYQLKDLSGNQTQVTSTIEVYDHLEPTIEKLKPIYLNVGESFNYTLYYKIKDNVDSFPLVKVDLSKVDFNQLGTYDFSITATDQSGLSTTFYDNLTIHDTIKPTIILTKQTVTLDYGEPINDEHLRSYIVRVTDNYDQLSKDDVKIYHDIESHVLGTYKVYYEISDQSLNLTLETLTLVIKDMSPPIIEVIKDLRSPVFGDPPLLYDYFEVSDLYDQASLIDVKITSTIKMNIVGKYLLTIKATDRSRNEANMYVYFEVYDDIAPMIYQKQDIIITTFKKIPLTHYFELTDQYDDSSKLTIEIDDSNVIYDQVGYYPLYVYAKDQSQNETRLETEIIVVDVDPPILTLKQSFIYISLETSFLDLSDFIHEAYDLYDDIDKDNVQIASKITFHQAGRYEVIYTLIDHALNHSESILIVVIEDTIKPTLVFEHMTIYPDAYFNVMDFVEAFDNDAIEGPIMCNCSHIDFSIPGEKTVQLYARDVRGNLIEETMIINVLPYPTKISALSYLPMLVVILIGGGVILLIRRGSI